MTITSYSFTPFYPFTQVEVTSDLTDPTYFWYVDGVYFARTAVPWVMVHMPEDDQGEVIAIDTTSPDAFDVQANAPTAYPARRELWWTRSQDADVAFHRVKQQREAEGYETIEDVAVSEDWAYRLITPRLDDLTNYDWRVVPVDAAGNEGTALALGPEKIVRKPDAPNYSVSFDGGTGRITVSAA